MPTDNNTLVTTPIADTSLSKELRSFFQKHNYKNLQQILQHKISVQMNRPGFTAHMLHDFLEFLKQNNIANLLKE